MLIHESLLQFCQEQKPSDVLIIIIITTIIVAGSSSNVPKQKCLHWEKLAALHLIAYGHTSTWLNNGKYDKRSPLDTRQRWWHSAMFTQALYVWFTVGFCNTLETILHPTNHY